MVNELNIDDDLRSVFRAIATVARKKADTGPLIVQLVKKVGMTKRQCLIHVDRLLGLRLVKGYYDKNSTIRYTLSRLGVDVARKLNIHL